jgi:hypothetical protein
MIKSVFFCRVQIFSASEPLDLLRSGGHEMRGMVLTFVGTMLLMPAIALAEGGLVGQCADCHTMHNSQGGHPVALQFGKTTPDGTRNRNLLKFDCLACHAQNPTGPKLAIVGQGSTVPQVFHGDTSDLAAGNFKHILTGGDRKGHNVTDIFGSGDTTMATRFGEPPGKDNIRTHSLAFGGTATPYQNFTCAGSVGCHGTRSQLLSGHTETVIDAKDRLQTVWVIDAQREGLPAISGAHHNNFDGLKNPAQVVAAVHDGAAIAASYRFINGLKGTGNVAARWQNLDSSSHNEYFGVALPPDNSLTAGNGTACNACHVSGTLSGGGTTYKTFDSSLRVPNQSMSGFCITCHDTFHSSGLEANNRFPDNGTSGAFTRPPSDYVIPNRGEYAAYVTYDVTAPVARPTLYAAADSNVAPGTDMVMCLSCHKAHASEYDGMLRFDYNSMTAQISAGAFATVDEAKATGGCLACHTTKGVLPGNR